MAETKQLSRENEKLAQAAIRCYLSTLLAVTDSMAEACPDIGMTFKRRWARAPQRIGFDTTISVIEESAQTFEKDVRAFGTYAGHFFQPALPLVRSIADRGAGAVEGVLDGLASHSVMLETLAESIAVTADLENAPPAIRQALEHQAAGLLNCARKVENEVLPRIAELQAIFRDCRDLIERAKAVVMADPESGVLNYEGFCRELSRRRADGSLKTLLRLQIKALLKNKQECSEEQFAEIVKNLSSPIFEQFRANESIGLVGREFLILFGGTVQQALGRQQDIERRLAGIYKVGTARVDVDVHLEAADSVSEEWAKRWLSAPEDVPVAFPIPVDMEDLAAPIEGTTPVAIEEPQRVQDAPEVVESAQ